MYQGNCFNIEDLIQGNEFYLMYIILVPWEHSGKNQLRDIKKFIQISCLFCFGWVGACVCARERRRQRDTESQRK